METVKVAMAGLSPTGLRYLNTLQRDERFEVCVVADTDAAARRRLDPTGNYCVHDDYRSLVLESSRAGLDVLVVALEPFQTRDLLPLAADHGIAVFHKSPFARTVREGRRIVGRFEERHTPLFVAREWVQQGMPAAASWLQDQTGAVYTILADIQVACCALDWRGDGVRAGGGVLLNGAYEVVDWLVEALGLPDVVFAVCGFAQVSGTTRCYDTEDHVAVVFRWSGDRSATLTARRCAGAGELRMTVVGTGGTVIHTAAVAGLTADEEFAVDSDAELLAQVAAAAAPSRGRPAEAGKHLQALAVIEAAYLSSRTGSPEAPSRFLP